MYYVESKTYPSLRILLVSSSALLFVSVKMSDYNKHTNLIEIQQRKIEPTDTLFTFTNLYINDKNTLFSDSPIISSKSLINLVKIIKIVLVSHIIVELLWFNYYS